MTEQKYIITEEQLTEWESDVAQRAFDIAWQRDQIAIIRSNPYNPQAERDLPHLTSTELLLVAHDEWKCRQKRKHYNDKIPWTSGWISGFLTSRKWVNEKVAELRQEGKDGESRMTTRKYCNINRHCPDWKVVRFRECGQQNEYGCIRPLHDDCEGIEKRKKEELRQEGKEER